MIPVVLPSVFCWSAVANDRTRTVPVVKLDVAANEVVLLLEAGFLTTQQRVIERLDFERAVEAFHGGVVVAIGCSRVALSQTHAGNGFPEDLSRIDAAAITVSTLCVEER